ncbi:hypothetical protein HDU86_005931 [Geranomyces michiganensis]|nr:hypothetical protein HDU86_005931 [Geranomyces michiganensis]
MGFLDKLIGHQAQSAHAQVYGLSEMKKPHQAGITHELIAAAAGYEAMKAYEKHCEVNGKPESHEKMKEILASIAAAEIDKHFETKGLDWLDKEKAKRMAVDQAHLPLDVVLSTNLEGFRRQFHQLIGVDIRDSLDYDDGGIPMLSRHCHAVHLSRHCEVDWESANGKRLRPHSWSLKRSRHFAMEGQIVEIETRGERKIGVIYLNHGQLGRVIICK